MGVAMTEGGGSNGGKTNFGELFKDEYAVILLQGKNSFGDMIYSYVEVTMDNIKKLYSALNSGEDFSPSDFGTIVASGTGTPPDTLRQEMEANHNMMQPSAPTVFQPQYKNIPTEKKAWDEF